MRPSPGDTRLVDTASGTYQCEILVAFPIGDDTVYDVRITDPAHPGSNVLGAVRADRLHQLPAGVCNHGQCATLITVVDQTRKNDRDEFGDIAGPMRPSYRDIMERIRDQRAGEHADEPGRFVLGFIHDDGCRTEQER
jgi:hypothetical protein